MLWKASGVNGYAIAASDGRLGTVSDILFDDVGWLVRWLVVDTGKWLTGRKVLLPPSVLGHMDPVEHVFPVRLSMTQVKDCPDIDTARPVSRQMERQIYDYYGWTPYWGAGLYMGGYGYVGEGSASLMPLGTRWRQENIGDPHRNDGDPHLRSSESVTGYDIHATDGDIGHVEDFLVEDADWSIHYLIVDTKNWWPGKKVLISPRSVKDIDWANKLVSLDVDRARVKASPEYDSATLIDQTYERHFHSHYGDQRPGDQI